MREGREGERRWDGRELHVHGDVYTCTCIRYGGRDRDTLFFCISPSLTVMACELTRMCQFQPLLTSAAPCRYAHEYIHVCNGTRVSST